VIFLPGTTACSMLGNFIFYRSEVLLNDAGGIENVG